MSRETIRSKMGLRNQVQSPSPVVSLILAMLALVSCTVAPTQTAVHLPIATPTSGVKIRAAATETIPLTRAADWKSRWMRGIPCRAPCWEGITPGETSASQAVEILSRSPLVENVRMEQSALGADRGVVSWNWVNGQQGGFAGYPAKTAAQIIDAIAPDYQESFRWGDIMQTYGEPSHIIAFARQAPDAPEIYYTIRVIYLPQGLVLRGGGQFKPDLGEDTALEPPEFIMPTKAGLEGQILEAKLHPEWVLAWEGFKGFDYYCRDMSNGKECHGK